LWQTSANIRVKKPQSLRQISRGVLDQVPLAANHLPPHSLHANIGKAKIIWSSEKQ
jgi:hypothetical protein